MPSPHHSRSAATPSSADGAGPYTADLFRACALRRGNRTALVHDGRHTTYRDLLEAADTLAAELRAAGAGPGAAVAVELPRGPDLYAALLGVLASGAAYVPLDPALPGGRRELCLAQSGAGLLVRHGAQARVHVEAVGGDTSRGAHRDPLGDDLAYVMFTSGTTGEPKAVGVPHCALLAHTRSTGALFGLGSKDRVLQFAGPGFDVFLEEVVPTLLAGGTVVTAPRTVPSSAELEACLRDCGVTVANLPSPYWDAWVRDLDSRPRRIPTTLRLLVVGSDVTHTRTLARWRRHSAATVINAYGLTETAVTATAARFDITTALPAEDTLPIGTPLPTVSVHLLDEALREVPPGLPGEIHVGGLQLAAGYLGRPGLTAERFGPDPADPRPGARRYRTGDLAVRDAAGSLHFVGRRDDQVKVGGERVETSGVAAALCRHPLVRQAHVEAVEDAVDGKRLIAYVVADGRPTENGLRDELTRTLPTAALPARYVLLDTLPLTPTGKLDRAALPPPPPRTGQGTAGGTLRDTVADLWADILQADTVGLDDRFLEGGGTSLKLMELQRRLTDHVGRPVPAAAFFAHPTVRALADHLDRPAAPATEPTWHRAAEHGAAGHGAAGYDDQRARRRLARRTPATEKEES